MADVTRAVLGRIGLRRVPACALPGAAPTAAAAPPRLRHPAPAEAPALSPAALRAVLAYLAEG